MMSKSKRWHETLVNSTSNKPAQKTGGKEPAASAGPASSGGKSTQKTTVSFGRSNSLSSRGGDSAVSGSRAGGSLKRGGLGQQGLVGQQGTRAASRPSRPSLRLCSSRSFSSLHTPSLTAAPFIRSSRSLSRLDQRPTKAGKFTHVQTCVREQSHGDDAETMKTCSSSEQTESSSSLVSDTERHHHCDKVKKQSRDGVHTLCAMTSGMRRNLVQAVLKNVRPSPTPDVTSSLPEQQPASPPSERLENAEHTNSCSEDCAEDTQRQQKEQELNQQSPADQSSTSSTISSSHPFSPVSPSASSALSPIGPSQQMEDGEGASCPLVTDTQTGESVDKLTQRRKIAMLSHDECLDERSNVQSDLKEDNDEQQVSTKELQTGQLVKELEQTQRELSRLQQLNRKLQDELRQQTESHSPPQINDHSVRPEQALTLQRLQKMNHDLRSELEALKTSHEEAREAELRRRVDLLAQQAQLLVTGDATALAQAHLEQDRRQFQEQRTEWEHCIASLKSTLTVTEEQRREGEEQRREAEERFTQLQQEVQGYQSLQQEADRLKTHLQELRTQLHANEEAQTQKEARLQNHLLLLQASQDRERRSLAACLAQAEQHSQDLQERLDQAEEQVGSLSKTQTWTREIERAQQQLQEELACTVFAVQKLQEEREQLDHRCEELQSQLSEADEEVSRLQSRLKTDETLYYNLEHSYERVCEELQVAVGRVQQKEADTQEIREGYERLLDRKEQELTEVLLKMEVLGNSLEETELKLSDNMKVCSCTSSPQKDESSETAPQQTTDPLRSETADSGQLSSSADAVGQARSRSHTVDSHHCDVTAGDDPEKFMSVIQTLETKLFVTEEKLRDIMQRLEEHQGHTGCQDPHLCSQLTRSRATAQHLSLLLHSQAKQSQRFAQETENRCRMLVGRFQVALNIIRVCRDRIQATPINLTEFEKHLATAAACLQQGEKDAEKQLRESRNASRGEDKILNDEASAGAERKLCNTPPSEGDTESVGKCLRREIFVVEKMVSVLQSQHSIGLLHQVPREEEGDVASGYRSIICQRIALKTDRRTPSGRAECNSKEPLDRAIGRVCADAELIYTAFKLQQQYETQADNQEEEHQRNGLADVNPPELAPYEQQEQVEGAGLEEAAGETDESDVPKEEAEKEPDCSERLISRLQRRAEYLRQLCQDTSDGDAVEDSAEDNWENASAADINWMQEQAKLIYLSEKLYLDLEQQSEVLKDRLKAVSKDEVITLTDEQEAFNQTLSQLQEDNTVLREELERAELKIISVETGNQTLLENMQEIEDYHEERMKKLEAEFQKKITELQHIHEEEMKHLHGYYSKSCVFKEKSKACTEAPADQTVMERKTQAEVTKIFYQIFHLFKAAGDESFTALEEMHRQLIGDLQQQHQQEVAALLKEKEQLLQEETAATMAAIVAMRRAHKQELQQSRQSQHIKESADITQLHMEHEKELQSLHKELEVLSVQHTQKCLENSQLNAELQEERHSSMQYQRENQELKNQQRETDEMSEQHFSLNGKPPHVSPQVNDFYEMEVILRAREAEMQFLRQEARCLREELKVARMDKLYAQNKLKALYTNSPDEPSHDVNKLCEDFSSLSPDRDASAPSLEDAVNTNKAAFLKKEKSSLTRQIRGLRSKSLKEGLSVQERMKLFESV
uniref:trichohyalin n=1 Tax=Semicossyphus pulcher TaxID=241346 RepID=UPI0037E7E95F